MIELLVVIAIIGIIAALLLPVLSAAKERAIRTKCLSNVKQFSLGLVSYANENRERLPIMTDGQWVWDVGRDVVDTIIRSGTSREIMYDPGNPDQNVDRFWNWAPPTRDNRPGYRVIGYAMTLRGCPTLIGTNQNDTIAPTSRQFAQAMLPPEDPSRRVLLAGAVISAHDGFAPAMSRAPNYNWTRVVYGLNVRNHRSSHLDRKRKMPVGDNQGMLDGSGRWKVLKQMIPRTENSTAVFWW